MIYLALILTFITMIVDLKERRIPNYVLVVFFISGLIVSVLTYGYGGLITYFSNGFLGLMILILPYVFKQVGAGDVKLVAVISALLGIVPTINVCIYFSVLGAGIVLTVLSLKSYLPILMRCSMEKSIPYALPIHLGVIFYYFNGGLI